MDFQPEEPRGREEAPEAAAAQQPPPRLHTDLALIDILSNRCIRHLKHDGKRAPASNTDAYLRAEASR